MAKGKSFRLDGVVLNFYICFHNIIGEGFFKMRIIAVKEGHILRSLDMDQSLAGVITGR
jgi:hypothetical protein